LKLDRSFYGENLLTSKRIWIEDAPKTTDFRTSPRIGIDYADEEWRNKQWRFVVDGKTGSNK